MKARGTYMLWGKKYLCSNCKTGKDSYELDNHSETCPHIAYYEKNKCNYYVPLESNKKTLWEKISGVITGRK